MKNLCVLFGMYRRKMKRADTAKRAQEKHEQYAGQKNNCI